MKIIAMLCLSALSLIVTSRANATISDADAAQLMAKYNCQACHRVDKQLVGPAFRDIAKKYKADAGAASFRRKLRAEAAEYGDQSQCLQITFLPLTCKRLSKG